MAEKPKKGDYATAREVVHGDYRDTKRGYGVIVGEPKRKDDYYTILSPYDPNHPFKGHVDDARPIADDDLSDFEKAFKDDVNRQLHSDQ